MKRALMGIAMLVWGSVATGGLARADVPPPEVELCAGKAPNDPCGEGNGRCQDGTCSRATPDGSVDYQCFKCVDGNSDTSAGGGGCAAGGEGAGALALAAVLGLVGVAVARRRAA
ncbi:MAG: hypothetical protein H6745_12635 [Deltaproteobacteria bacterium]|nr:hypothetical protein [Deltaproteobacteria bacterium]